MTVLEYAVEWCSGQNENSNAEITNKEALEQIDYRLEEARGIVPPDELKAYHAAEINVLTAIRSSLSLESPEETFNPFSLFVVALAVGAIVEQVENELSTETYSILSDAGCIEAVVVESTPTPEPTPDVPGLSVDNPVPVDGILEGSDGTQTVVLNIVEDAWPLIKAENETSYSTPTPPKEGYRFLMISLQVAYVSGTDSVFVSESKFSLIDDSRVLHTSSGDSCGGYSNTIPEQLSGEIFVGGKTAGNICFEIRKEASDLILIHEPPFFSLDGERRFLRLE